MKTIAFVVGNNDYYEGAQLIYAVNDASEIASVFRRLGYDVIEKLNCNNNDCSDLLISFEEKLKDYDASIFYYAGHGFQLGGENYLASIECQVHSPNIHHCNRTCIRLSEILDILKKNSGKVNVVIIDACRKEFERGGINSFTPIQAPKGTLIAFSTSPNEGAKDGGGQGGHSVYTSALLQYIGREAVSIESLFKKVRKTVYNLTEGTQTTWEHTSLIGDFFFNTGQLVYTIEIPYDETVVKDSLFDGGDNFGNLILDLKSCDWNRQNPAMCKIRSIPVSELDKNQQFILGRNLYQASGYAFEVERFFEKIEHNLLKYNEEGINHVLNGILFEIYFDSRGDFRHELKRQNFERIFSLRKNPRYTASFDFINTVLQPYKEQLFYIPNIQDQTIDIDIVAENQIIKTSKGEETIQIISKVLVADKDITKPLSRICPYGINNLGMNSCMSEYFTAPVESVKIHSNIPLQKITFAKELFEEDLL